MLRQTYVLAQTSRLECQQASYFPEIPRSSENVQIRQINSKTQTEFPHHRSSLGYATRRSRFQKVEKKETVRRS